MHIKKVVKRLIALGAGATMLGATVMGAMAADLSSYPSSFQTDGVFNGYFVVGEAAKPIDNLAMTDIATSMWYNKPGETATTTVEGDAWKVGTSTDTLELMENIYDVESYIGEDNLAALSDGSIANAKGTANYEQFLYFEEDSDTSNVALFAEDDDENLELFYKVVDGKQIGRYFLEFGEALQSDWHLTNYWKDIKDEQLTMLGQTFDIVTAANTISGPKLTLMGGSVKDTLLEGESATYAVSGVDYEVTLTYVDSDNGAKFNINGEMTDTLAAGETDKLADGTTIGASEVLYQSYAGGIHSCTFFLGADKVVLQNGTNLEVGDETYSESPVIIDYSESSAVLSIDSISINMTADDDYYVAAGGKITDVMKTPDSLLGDWDIEFQGLDVGATEEIKIAPYSGDEKYKLYFTTSAGNAVSLPMMYTNSSAHLFGGEKDGYELILNASASIARHNNFVLNTADADSKDGNSKTYILEYKGRDATDDTDPKVTFSILGGDDIERSLSATGTFDIKLGGKTFNFVNTSAGADKNGAIQLNDAVNTLDFADFTMKGSNAIQMRTSNNVELTLTDLDTNDSASDWTLTVAVDDTDRMNDLAVVQNVTYTFADTTPDVDASIGSTAQTDRPYYWESNPDNDNEILGYDLYGTYLVQVAPDTGSKTATWTVPETQSEALLFVTSGATTATTAGDGELALVQVVDATKLDTEVADSSAQNLIVVGGPCVNSVAASLLGNPADCTEGFTPGKARIKMVDTGAGNMAMLVAGYTGDDTRLAGKVVSHRYAELTGEEVEVAGTTYSDATIGVPTIVEEVVEEVVEEETPEE